MSDYVNVTELFGCDVFNDSVMEERLPKKVYKELKKTIEEGKELSPEVADEGMGNRERCDTLQPLVPATDRCDSREARCFYHSTEGKWQGSYELFR